MLTKTRRHVCLCFWFSYRLLTVMASTSNTWEGQTFWLSLLLRCQSYLCCTAFERGSKQTKALSHKLVFRVGNNNTAATCQYFLGGDTIHINGYRRQGRMILVRDIFYI